MKYMTLSQIVKATLILAALLLLLGSTVLADNAGGGGPFISRYVIGGGGGHLQAGAYVLDGTVGQAVAGIVNSPSYNLCAGFWCGLGYYKVYLPVVMRTS